MRTAEGGIPMAPERVERKQVTIFVASVEGYFPVMRADGGATLKTSDDYRKIIDTLNVRHGGRVRRGILLIKYHPVGQIATGYVSTATEQRCKIDAADQRTGRTRCRQH